MLCYKKLRAIKKGEGEHTLFSCWEWKAVLKQVVHEMDRQGQS